MMSLDQENLPTSDIYLPCLPTLITISRISNTLSSPQLPHRITLDDIVNTPDVSLEAPGIDTHQSIIDHHWEPNMKCNAFWLLILVIADTNTIQMAIL